MKWDRSKTMMNRENDMDIHIVIFVSMLQCNSFSFSFMHKNIRFPSKGSTLNDIWSIWNFFLLPIVQTIEIFPFSESFFYSQPFYMWIYSELEPLLNIINTNKNAIKANKNCLECHLVLFQFELNDVFMFSV